MIGAIHFIGFRDQRAFDVCAVLLGRPDFVHVEWDVRAAQEIAPGDSVVFAADYARAYTAKYWACVPRLNAFDDSAVDVHAYERSIGERP